MSWEAALLIALLMLSLVVPLGRALARAAEEARRAELEQRRRPPATRSNGGRAPLRRPRVPEPARRVREAALVSRRRRPTVVADPAVMRRGIVLMTVLGPCRGLEPFDQFPRVR